LSTHKSITRDRFIKVFELESLVDIDEWLLSLPKELGVFLNVKGSVIKFERKASDRVKLKLAEHFDDWITDVMSRLTRVSEYAVKAEINRIPSILGGGYTDFFKMNIKKEERKFVLLQLTGSNQFTTKSDYGDKTYTTFTVNKEVKERVTDFQPDLIEEAKKSIVEHEVYQRNGKRYHYVSPAGRNISRSVRTSEKDFHIKLINLLIDVVPVENYSYSILAPTKKQNIVHVSSPRKMCVMCGNTFRPDFESNWEIKYLSMSNVYVCEECNPNLKKTIQEEKAKRSQYNSNLRNEESTKSRIKKFFGLFLMLFLGVASLLAFGLPLIAFYISSIVIAILAILEVSLLIKWNLTSNEMKKMKTEESFRKNKVLYSVKRYDGNLLEKRFIPEFCQRCRWFNNDDLKCHVDEEVGEIYNEFNVNGEKECFELRN